MNSFWANVGFLAVCGLVVWLYKKALECYDFKHEGFHENEKVYEAAEAFLRGAPDDEVRTMLETCADFDRTDSAEILQRAARHRDDRDGGYSAFIQAVNGVLGEEIYSERSCPRENRKNSRHSGG